MSPKGVGAREPRGIRGAGPPTRVQREGSKRSPSRGRGGSGGEEGPALPTEGYRWGSGIYDTLESGREARKGGRAGAQSGRRRATLLTILVTVHGAQAPRARLTLSGAGGENGTTPRTVGGRVTLTGGGKGRRGKAGRQRAGAMQGAGDMFTTPEKAAQADSGGASTVLGELEMESALQGGMQDWVDNAVKTGKFRRPQAQGGGGPLTDGRIRALAARHGKKFVAAAEHLILLLQQQDEAAAQGGTRQEGARAEEGEVESPAAPRPQAKKKGVFRQTQADNESFLTAESPRRSGGLAAQLGTAGDEAMAGAASTRRKLVPGAASRVLTGGLTTARGQAPNGLTRWPASICLARRRNRQWRRRRGEAGRYRRRAEAGAPRAAGRPCRKSARRVSAPCRIVSPSSRGRTR